MVSTNGPQPGHFWVPMEGINSSTRAALAPVSVYSGQKGQDGGEQHLKQHGKNGARRLSVGAVGEVKKGAVIISPSKKRRSQSMGGALSEAAAVARAVSANTTTMELSPRSE